MGTFNEWVHHAYNDFDSAKYLYDGDKAHDIVIYHCHQSLEKFLKSLWIKHGLVVKKTHDLRELVDGVRGQESWLNEFLEGILELNTFLKRIRYPQGDLCTREDAMQCVIITEVFMKRFKLHDPELT